MRLYHVFKGVFVPLIFLLANVLEGGAGPAAAGELLPDKLDTRLIAEAIAKMDNGLPYNTNFADEGEYHLFLQNLALGGKTPKNSPQLFRVIERKRELHKAGEFKLMAGFRAEAEEGDIITAETINVITGATSDGAGTFEAQGLATLRDGSPHTFGLITLRDHETGTVFAHKKLDNYGAKVNFVDISAYSSQFKQVYGLFVGYYLDSAGGMHDYKVKLATGVQVPVITNEAPVSKSGAISDDCVVCVNRVPQAENNCQYGKLNDTNNVKFPVKGNIVYPKPVKMKQVGVPVDGEAVMFLVKSNIGGGCVAWGPKNDDFWSKSVFSGDKLNLTWDFDPADFGQKLDCMNNGDSLDFTLRVTVFDDDFNMMPGILTSTPPDEPGPNWAQVSPIKLFVGCMAKGTLVELDDGRQMTIETFEAEGEKVITGSGVALKVIGNTIGTEEDPMVRIKTEVGYSLMLTQNHPVMTRDHGFKLAKDLTFDDLVVTRDGPQKVVSISRKKYDDYVYNLALEKIGDQSTEINTTFFANGILVGDYNIQEKNSQVRNSNLTHEEILEKLPKEWHQDYLLSLKAK